MSENPIWYRGYEIYYERSRYLWTGDAYAAYKGGLDLDARYVTGKTLSEVKEAVDGDLEDL